MPADRRLIEDFIPIREISAEASREKSIRKGHISTLHLWWARRPLVAARAAVYAALVPAPQTPEEREQYQREMVALCRWEVGDEALQQARQRILAANGGVAPKVLDMFAGGGAIPLEALRLGCETYAVDLNPVAHLIQLCTLVYPQQFGPQLAEEVERWGRWVLERVREEIGDLYPLIDLDGDKRQEVALASPAPPQGRRLAEQHALFVAEAAPIYDAASLLQPVAYLWTRTVRCPNPTCVAVVPLVRQTWLSKKERHYVALKLHADQHLSQGERRVRFEVVEAASEAELGFDPAGFSERGNALCPFCGSTVSNGYVKAEGKAGRMATQLMAVLGTLRGRTGKVYVAADELDSALFSDDAAIRVRIGHLCAETGLTVPEEPIFSGDSRAFFTHLYGLDTFGSLYTSRQMLCLLTFCKFVRKVFDEAIQQGANVNLAKAVASSLAMWVDRLADFNSTLCTLKPGGGRGVVHTFTRQALPMIWDFAEINPFCNSATNAEEMLNWLTASIRFSASVKQSAVVHRGSATRLEHSDGVIDAIVTDPPYYDNVPYANLADYFYVWLKRSIGGLYPEHLSAELNPKKQEAVSDPTRHGGSLQARQFYENQMQQAFTEAYRVLKVGAPLIVVYAHKTTTGWSTLVDSLRRSGFVVTEAWPLDTEMAARLRGQASAALATSLFIVTRKREQEDVGNYTRDVRPELQRIVKERVGTLRALGIAGADLVIACVGAGLRAYTQFARVELPNGDELAASAFLDEVQRAVLEVILADVMGVEEAGVSAVDKVSQYYVLARYQYGTTVVDFDEANVLARGVGVELDGPRALTSGSNPLVKKTKTSVEWRDYRVRGDDDDLGLFDGQAAPLVDVLQRLLWLNEHQPAAVLQFLAQAAPDVARLKLVAEALGGKGLAAEPSPGGVRDERSEEQKAIGRLLPAWKRVVEDAVQGRLL